MTKKVLISLDELIEICGNSDRGEMGFDEKIAIDWFESQPDVPLWKDCSHNDIPLNSQAVVVFNEEDQITGLAWMNDGFVWQDIHGELGENDLIDFWIEMPGPTGG